MILSKCPKLSLTPLRPRKKHPVILASSRNLPLPEPPVGAMRSWSLSFAACANYIPVIITNDSEISFECSNRHITANSLSRFSPSAAVVINPNSLIRTECRQTNSAITKRFDANVYENICASLLRLPEAILIAICWCYRYQHMSANLKIISFEILIDPITPLPGAAAVVILIA